MPTRIDAVTARRDPSEELPFPYNHLGPTTLIELETPGEYLAWQTARKQLGKWAYYSVKEGIQDTAGVSLWLVVSRVSENMLAWLAREHGGGEKIGPGLWRTSCHGSPLLVIDQRELPLTVETLPLLMAYKGPREREIAEFALRHGKEYPFFLEQAMTYHPLAVQEVLDMIKVPVESRGLVNVKDIVNLLKTMFGERELIEQIGEEELIRGIGQEKIIREIGEEKLIRGIGEEKIIREIGEERVVEDLLKELGPDRLRELVERKTREHEGNGKS